MMPLPSAPLAHGPKPTPRPPLLSPNCPRMRRSESSQEPAGRVESVLETPAQPTPLVTHRSVYKVRQVIYGFTFHVHTIYLHNAMFSVLLANITKSNNVQMGRSASVTYGVQLPSLPGYMLRALGILIWSVKGDRSLVLKQRPLVFTSSSAPLRDLWASLLKVAVTGRALDLTLTFK
jgi:hypothetical protein